MDVDLNALAATVAKLRLDLNEARQAEDKAVTALEAAQKVADAKHKRHLAAWKELESAVALARGDGVWRGGVWQQS